ncbi:Seipin-2 [Sesamum alatum]|uniref:Seipin-2 n=1 Tax=Sesamum alatum TaxID=300844 RepID=A0AAE1Z1F4_9LAMI|nr:Seipin-2 [Sesamum alatum]
MEDAKLNTLSGDDEEEFRDALDDFTFYDCEEHFSDPIVSNGVVLQEDETVPTATLRLRRSRKASGGDSMDMSRPSSSVTFENILNSGDEKVKLSFTTKECEKKLENENSESVEPGNGLETAKDSADGENNEKNDERSNLTGENNNIEGGLVGDENCDAHMSPLLTLAGLTIKVISFQIDMLVKSFMFPLRLIYYLYMLVFDPFGFLKRGREYLLQEMKSIWSLVFENVSPFVYEWLKDHQAIWKLGLKCGWGLVWSSYVCTVLVALLVSAFVMGGLLIRVVVEEPMRMKTNLNFDYTEKSPVAFVPITAFSELSHDIHLEEMPGLAMGSGSRAIPPNYKFQAAISLTLPESEYNQNLGIFQVRVDFLATDGTTLASSKRPCMLQYRSQPIRLLLTLLKVAPILTGYTTETQNLKINFRGFTEGNVPTACLRVVIEQRAEFLPGAGIPEIYAASLTLESKLPLLKRALWFWKKTLFVWISMTIFIMELAFALICCKPIIVPKIKLREASNRGASQNECPSQS